MVAFFITIFYVVQSHTHIIIMLVFKECSKLVKTIIFIYFPNPLYIEQSATGIGTHAIDKRGVYFGR